MNNENIKVAEWTQRGEKLLAKARNTLAETNIDCTELPSVMGDDRGQVSLVFAGQYSAGKSTILKALTGIESIETGAGITTQQAHTYDWNGMKVIDTPGIHTKLRPDHDEISNKAISESDMLIYVVTQELFDSFIGAHFRKLLIDDQKGKEMVLVINKMADIGNTPKNQEVKLDALRSVTSPFSPEELHAVFIDAESYIESKEEEDQEIAAELMSRSCFDRLIATLNSFSSAYSLTAKLTTPLYTLQAAINGAILTLMQSDGDKEVNALEMMKVREREMLISASREIRSVARSLSFKAASVIREEARRLADRVTEFKSEQDANDAIKDAQAKVQNITDKYGKDAENEIRKVCEKCNTDLDNFYRSDFVVSVNTRINACWGSDSGDMSRILNSGRLKTFGMKISDRAIGSSGVSGLRAFSGSSAHNAVLNIGHFFGHSFKPWEAVKWAKGIGTAGPVISVIASLWELADQAEREEAKHKHAQEIRDLRGSIRVGFSAAADAFEKYLNNAAEGVIKESFEPATDTINADIEQIRKMRSDETETRKKLIALDEECKALIKEIQAA